MTTFSVKSFDGLELNAVLSGDAAAPGVVLSHSIGCDLHMWDAIAGTLEADFRVLRFDRRGHGRSGVPAADAGIETLGRDVLAIMDACGLRRAHFVGLSQGGMEGMWLGAHASQRIDHLVLANTTAHLGVPAVIQGAIDAGRAQGMAAVGNGFLDRWLPEEFRTAEPEATAQLRSVFASMTPQGFAAPAAVLRDVDLRPDLSRIDAPTLVVVGGAEPPPLQAAAQGLVAAIQGARLAVIAGAGHLSAVDHPDEFCALLHQFLGAARPLAGA